MEDSTESEFELHGIGGCWNFHSAAIKKDYIIEPYWHLVEFKVGSLWRYEERVVAVAELLQTQHYATRREGRRKPDWDKSFSIKITFLNVLICLGHKHPNHTQDSLKIIF